jgi:hypothetical protein
MARICLYGGECDGYEEETNVTTHSRPEVFYAVPLLDMGEIKILKDPASKMAMKTALSTLAYAFKDYVPHSEHGLVYRYLRCAEKDKDSPADLTH